MYLKQKLIKNKHTLIILGGLLGMISFIFCYGLDVLNFSNDTWLLASERDLRAHYIGWEFFRNSNWYFPLGMMDSIIYPRLVSIIYTDSIPLLAIFFKLFRNFLPETFQYFGLWGLLCFMAQGICACYIMNIYSKNIIFNLAATEFFVLSPILIQRLYFHSELAAHFLILIAFIIWIDRDRFNSWKRKALAWSILLMVSSGIHIYFIPIIVIIMTSSLLYDAIHQKCILKPMMVWLISIILTLIMLWILGAFSSGRALGAEGGLGYYNANLNALFNSQKWEGIVPSLPVATEGQYEGYAYLGLGILILFFMCIGRSIYTCKNEKRIKDKALIISILFCLMASLLCALGPSITIENVHLLNISYPSFIIAILNMFRATGRFMWILVYMILIYIFSYMAKWQYSVHYKKTVFSGLLIVCLILQIIDLLPLLSLRRDIGDKEKYYSEAYNSLQSPIWEKISGQYKHIEMMEDEMLVHTNYKDSFSLAQFAVTHDMTISNFAAARPNVELRNEIIESNYQLLENDQIDSETIYVFGNPFYLLGKEVNLYIYEIDGIVIGVKNKITKFTEEDNAKIYENTSYEMDFSNNIFYIANDVENHYGVIKCYGNASEYILYGPYINIGQGVYNIEFDIDVLVGDGLIGYVEILGNNDTEMYAHKEIFSNDENIVLNGLCLPDIDDLNIRIFINEGVQVNINSITCELIGKDLLEDNLSFENGEMIYTLKDDNFLVASSGLKDKKTGEVTNAGKTECDLIYGPYITVPEGQYTVKWEYETQKSSDEIIGYIDVCSNGGENVIKRYEITNERNGKAILNFELTNMVWDLELRFHVYSNTKVIVKNVQMEVLN